MFFACDTLITRSRTMKDPITSGRSEALQPGVDVEGAAFVLVKDGHQATARVRVVSGVGLELRYLLDGAVAQWPDVYGLAGARSRGERQAR